MFSVKPIEGESPSAIVTLLGTPSKAGMEFQEQEGAK
jgi:hypothetical protein